MKAYGVADELTRTNWPKMCPLDENEIASEPARLVPARLFGSGHGVPESAIRQESQFVPDVQSGADARGLTQVVPSTASGIADQLGDKAFVPSMLYLLYLNVRYGTYYLASNLPQFNRKLIPTLAAYNGGPGNASRWLAGSALFDPDLYAERVDLFETGDYIQRVYQNYGFYKDIYEK